MPDDPKAQGRRIAHYEITPQPTPEEEKVLLAALELALGTEAREIPASGWSSPQYQDGSSLRPGMRIWSAEPESEAPTKPQAASPFRRKS